MKCDLSSPKVLVVAVIVAVFNTFDRNVLSACGWIVIWVKRRHMGNGRMHQAFVTYVNIFRIFKCEMFFDSHSVIKNIVPKYPGSVHDAFILRNSVNLRDAEYGVGWLLDE